MNSTPYERVLTIQTSGILGIVDRYSDDLYFWEAFREGRGPSYGAFSASREQAETTMRECVARLIDNA